MVSTGRLSLGAGGALFIVAGHVHKKIPSCLDVIIHYSRERYLCWTLLTVNMDEIRIPFDITKRVDLDRVVAKVETSSLFGR